MKFAAVSSLFLLGATSFVSKAEASALRKLSIDNGKEGKVKHPVVREQQHHALVHRGKSLLHNPAPTCEFAIDLDGYYYHDMPLLFNNTVVDGATYPNQTLTDCGVIDGGSTDRTTTWFSITGTGRDITIDTCSEERAVDTQIAVYKAFDRYG